MPIGAAVDKYWFGKIPGKCHTGILLRQPHELGRLVRLLIFYEIKYCVTQALTMEQNEKKGMEGWFKRGYDKGCYFARNEADYDELAAVYRAGGIPPGWDLFRAQILNQHLKDNGFNFQAYAAGFAQACVEFYQKI
jgi:hypothetical protein